MRVVLRHLPPVAFPIQPRDLGGALLAARKPEQALSQFRFALSARTGSPVCHLLTSGRAALAAILLGLRQLSERSMVIVPAYSCPTVVQAVMEAGLEPLLCDVSPQTLDLDREALHRLLDGPEGARVLAVVPTHLYGWAHDVRDLVSVGRDRGTFVIEDAAQAFGASFQGRMVGTWGDAGLYSLGRGKCLPAGGGGVIVAGAKCAPAIERVVADALGGEVPGRLRWDVRPLALVLGYGLATRPLAWWFLVRTPLNPADEGMDPEALPPIRLGPLSPVKAGIASSLLERLDQVHRTRRRNAERLMDLLGEFRFVTVPEIPPGSKPVFLRLPIIVDCPERARAIFVALHRNGIGVSRSYRRSLPDIFSTRFPGSSQRFPGAERLATCLLTLPTHHHLRGDDFKRVATGLRSAR